MKKLWLLLSLAAIALSGCYVVPHRDHDDGYRNGRDHRDDRHDNRDRDNRRDGDHGDRDGYR